MSAVVDPLVHGLHEDWSRHYRVEVPRPVGPLQRYWSDPVGFVRDCIRWPTGQSLTPYQAEVLAALPERGRVSVRGPHGLGKTAIKAMAVLWFALTRDGRDWKIPTTASAWYQLTHYLWPEIHKWARLLDWDRIGRPAFVEGRDLLDLSLKLNTGEAFAIASSEPARMEGAHADHLLYVFDEAKTILPATFDAAEGAFSGAGTDTASEALALMGSTPGEPNGRFYEIQSRQAGTEDWWARHVTRAEVIAAGRMSAQWVADRERQWGTGSAVFRNRVDGDFASSEADTVIPLPWVEAAVERWKAAQADWRTDAEGRPDPRWFTPKAGLLVLGVDVARSGEDRTVLAPRFGDVVGPLRFSHHEPTDVTTGRVEALLDAAAGERAKSVPAVVDVIGIGAGVVDQLAAAGYRAEGFNASEGTKRKDRSGELGFVNCRAAAWWALRDALDPSYGSEVALPPDDELIGDLTAPRWKVVGKGLIQVESKDDIRKRLGRSTDAGDGVVQSFWTHGGAAGVASPAARSLSSAATPQRSGHRVGLSGRGGGVGLAGRSR